MSSFTFPLTASFGATYSGLAASALYSVVDASNAVKIAATGTGITEQLDAAGNATTGNYSVNASLDNTWGPVRVLWTITGYAGVAAEESFNANEIDSSYQSGDSYAIVNNGTYGNSALHTQIVALPTDGSIATDVQTGLTNQGYTTARATKLDDLDATVSSRLATSGYTAPDNSDITAIKAKTDNLPAAPASTGDVTGATTTLATDITNATSPLATTAQLNTKIPNPLTVNAGDGGVSVHANLDKAGYALTGGEHTNITTDAENALTAQGYTSPRAVNLDNLDATVSSRLAASGYIAPDNADIAAIKAKTDNLPATPAAQSDVTSATTTLAGDITTATSTIATDITNATSPLATTSQLNTAVSTLSTDITSATAPLATSAELPANFSTMLINAVDQGVTVHNNLDKSGYTATVSGNVTVGGYAANEDPGKLVLGALLTTWNSVGTFGNFIQNISGGGGGGSASDNWTFDESVCTAPSVGYDVKAILNKLNTLGSSIVVSWGPNPVGLNFPDISRGDDYLYADGRALTWTSNVWVDLTGGTVVLNGISGSPISANIRVSGSGTQTVTVDLPNTITTALSSQNVYKLVATTLDGSVCTLAKGNIFTEA